MISVFVLTLYACLKFVRGFECPAYDEIAGVGMKDFSMDKLSGVWYVLATSEPTIPSFCKTCELINMTISDKDYFYDSMVHCSLGPNKLSITIGGHCEDPTFSGDCKENVAPWHHTIDPILVPNLFFNYSAATKTEPEWFMNYACVMDMLGMKMFSFSLNSRSNNISTEWIQEKIKWATESGVINISGLSVSDETVWESCKLNPSLYS